MSCLDYPRIHFNGKFSTNVCTANNDDMNVYDPATVGTKDAGMIDPKFYPIVNPVDTTLHPNLAKMSRADAHAWMKSASMGGPVPNAGWNYFGDHIVKFEGATVSKVDLGPNDSSTANDDLIGASVTLPRNAKMVDVDPTGSVNTQIYFGGFNLSSGGLGINYDSFQNPDGRKGRIAYSRLIGPRNLDGRAFTMFQSVWQFGIPNGSELTFAGAAGNAALAKLAEQAGNAQGLLIQFCAYYVQPLISNPQLLEDFAAGKRTHNPAVGHMVGTVGVWHEHDRATLPNGRNLAPLKISSPDNKYQFLNPVSAKLQDDKATVSLNLIATFPEQFASRAANADIQDPIALKDARKPPREPQKTFPPLKKVPFGALNLAVQNGTSVTVLGPIKGYDDYDAYQACAGIVEVPINPQNAGLLKDGDLLIQAEDGTTLFQETPFVAETDDHAVYLEQSQSADVAINMRLRGEPYDGPVKMRTALTPSTYKFNEQYFPIPPNAAEASFETECDNGILKGRVTAGKDTSLGVISCRAILPSATLHSDCEVSLRIYPDEDYSDPPAAERSWQEVYDITLKYYDYIFPGMGEILDLSDEELVTSQASAFLHVLDTPMENTQFMPVTRALPPARRDLLVNWLRAKTGLPPLDAVS